MDYELITEEDDRAPEGMSFGVHWLNDMLGLDTTWHITELDRTIYINNRLRGLV